MSRLAAAFPTAARGGPLGRLLSRHSIGWLDVVLMLAATVGGVELMHLNLTADDIDIDVPDAALPAILVVTLPVLWRTAATKWAAIALFAGTLLHVVAFGEVVRCGIVYPVTWLFAYSVGARLDRRDARLGLALVLGTQLAMTLGDGVLDWRTNVLFWPITSAVWWVGRVVHGQGAMVVELNARTAELRAARDERARLEVATDRARLSGQLDRLLQQRLGELAHLADRGAAESGAAAQRAAFVAIEVASRGTLEEMRDMVGVLRHDDTAPTAPQPTLTHLERLLEQAGSSRARLRVEGNPRVLPAGVELSAYRVVEHLLAALQADAGVDVCVRFGDDALELTVSGTARRRAEAAIERARERVELHRGTLVATTDGSHAEAVAHLPVLVTA